MNKLALIGSIAGGLVLIGGVAYALSPSSSNTKSTTANGGNGGFPAKSMGGFPTATKDDTNVKGTPTASEEDINKKIVKLDFIGGNMSNRVAIVVLHTKTGVGALNYALGKAKYHDKFHLKTHKSLGDGFTSYMIAIDNLPKSVALLNPALWWGKGGTYQHDFKVALKEGCASNGLTFVKTKLA
jgi:hypothetical protein